MIEIYKFIFIYLLNFKKNPLAFQATIRARSRRRDRSGTTEQQYEHAFDAIFVTAEHRHTRARTDRHTHFALLPCASIAAYVSDAMPFRAVPLSSARE